MLKSLKNVNRQDCVPTHEIASSSTENILQLAPQKQQISATELNGERCQNVDAAATHPPATGDCGRAPAEGRSTASSTGDPAALPTLMIKDGLKDFGDPDLKRLLNRRRTILRNLVNCLKRLLTSRAISDSDNKQKTVWKIIKRETRDAKPHENIALLNGGVVVDSPGEVASIFNSVFCDVQPIKGLRLDSGVCSRGRVIPQSFFFTPITPDEIEKSIISMKTKKSSGVDDMSAWLLKQCYGVF
ncbi:hypothetical protein J6590_088725 [Homalodisca vitripennis]|nr:hypothetical protein J6590_088725 [Homalodisca vitripennis]